MTAGRATPAFQFYTRLHLRELTGLRAASLQQLATLLERVPDAAIYHHTHQFLQQYQYLLPQPPNDFAHWVSTVLGDEALGERLASVDPIAYGSLQELRRALIAVIRGHLRQRPLARLRTAGAGQEFYFVKSISFIVPTPYRVHSLAAFAAALQQVTIDAIYFHIFEARLRLGRPDNEFSLWLGQVLGERELAQQIASLDPYSRTLEGVRQTILDLLRPHLRRARTSPEPARGH
ncbi:MAG: hypothetical protein HY597_01700 [Candidatus Omnitrophica bacterium]|nr:hypothetical protein [Candidatus Omnitrophota bacterium]